MYTEIRAAAFDNQSVFPMRPQLLRLLACICIVSCMCPAAAQNSDLDFVRVEVNQKPTLPAQRYRLAHPFEILYGPDDHLYVTERVGRVLRVNTTTGMRTVILDHRGSTYVTISRNGAGTATGIGQDGMMGMALHPNFGLGTGQDFIYLAYTYAAGQLRLSRFSYSAIPTPQLSSETVLLQGIPANNDHSSGRLIFGADGRLYYTCGDRGANQFGNRCQEIQSQQLPTAGQVSAANYSRYAGKTLRISPDGSIPADNPLFAGVRSHIFSIGHRNAQGLVTQKTPTDGLSYPTPLPGGRIFNSEHGPRTDDEINVLQAGGNYGWPQFEGPCPIDTHCDPNQTDFGKTIPPAYYYDSSATSPTSIIGGAFAEGGAYPKPYAGAYFFGDFNGWVRVAKFDKHNRVKQVLDFDTGIVPVQFRLGPDKNIHVLDFVGGNLYRYVYTLTP